MTCRSILCIAVAAMVSLSLALAETRLRTLATVDDDVIRLGDVLEDVGGATDVEVAPAPAPGNRIALPVNRIHAVAKLHGIQWRHRGPRSIVVQRDSRIVPHQHLVSVLEQALARSGNSGRFKIELANRNLILHVPRSAEPTIALEDFRQHERTGAFTAVVRAPASDLNAPQITVKGRAHPVIETPVLGHAVAIGDVIEQDDIVWTDIRLDQIRNGIVTEADDLIGYVPKRKIRPLHPIRSNEVQRPILVRKGEAVTMSFARVNLKLTTSGRALENGSKGESIRVLNVRTKKTVEGIVVGVGRISVNARADQVSSLR